jgi:fatty-acyl-CoA synthase
MKVETVLPAISLLDRMTNARLGDGRMVFLGAERDEELSRLEFFARAERVAAWLQVRRGIGPGSRVVVLASSPAATVTAVVATWLAGAAITCAPTPARTTDLATYAQQTVERINALDASLVLVAAPYDGLAADLGSVARVDMLAGVLAAEPTGAWKVPDLTPTDPAVHQFTSGTTSAPKIVRVSHGNLAANISAILKLLRHDEEHLRFLSWLPLSHDMGLIGALASQLTCGQCDLFIGSPADYLAAPSGWMRNAARHHATTLVAPASAYALAGRLLSNGPRLDLTTVRVAVCGGEPLDPDAIETFLESAAAHGFDPGAFVPAYGLAEATLLVTARGAGVGLRTDEVDADALAETRTATPAVDGQRARRLTRLGPSVPGTQLRIVDPDTGEELPERGVGEIQVHGPSIATYLPHSGPEDDDAGQAAVRHAEDGWLATGDLGYLTNGELVVCGRAKDLIIIGGRNIHPEEIEQATSRVPGTRPGNVVAFATRHTGQATDTVTIAVETRSGHQAPEIRDQVTAAVLTAIGVRPAAVLLLPPGSIPKTPSGKPQRAEAARLFSGDTP